MRVFFNDVRGLSKISPLKSILFRKKCVYGHLSCLFKGVKDDEAPCPASVTTAL